MIAIVATIGPIEFSEKQESMIDNVAMVANDKNAKANALKNLQVTSGACKITNPSLFKTMRSPVPNNILATTTAINANHKMMIKV